jgi:MtN3 and saliva related transmembrane protein
MDFGEVAGFCAFFIVISSFIPQMLRTLKTGKTRDLSLLTLILSFSGNFCWLLNAWHEENMPLFSSALILMLLLTPVIALKLKNDGFSELSFLKMKKSGASQQHQGAE